MFKEELYTDLPKLRQYQRLILSLDSFKKAKVEDFDELFNLRSKAN